MENELPTEAAPAAEQQATELPQNTDTGSDLAPDSGENHEEKPNDGELAQAAINKQHKKYRDEERGHNETKTQLQEAQRKLDELQTGQPAPVVPNVPDPLDFDSDGEYRTAVSARDATIIAVAQHETQQSLAATSEKNAANDRVLMQQAQAGEDMKTLAANAEKQGIKLDDLQVAAGTVSGYNLGQEIGQFLMTDEDGPVMIAYLAANPLIMDGLRSLPLGVAFGQLHGTIKTAAQALKPRTSGAPPPPDLLKGNGAREERNVTSSGMKYTTK